MWRTAWSSCCCAVLRRASRTGRPWLANEAGALPLLSHALLTTWSRSHGGLTVAGCQAGGGIRHAIARTADQVYQYLDAQQRDIARRLFLRLVYVADDAPQTRSPVPLDSCATGRAGPGPRRRGAATASSRNG